MKNINLIPAAVLSAASIIAFSAPLRGQAVTKYGEQILKSSEKSVAQLSKLKLPRYNFFKSPRVTAGSPITPLGRAVRSVASSQAEQPFGGISVRMPDPHVFRTQVEKALKRQEVLKAKRVEISRLEALSRGILQYRSELLKGYQLPEEYIEGFFLRRIFPYLQKPSYTPDKNESILFRGMLLSPEELVEILKKGFSPATTKWNTGAKAPAVSFSSSSAEATHYIFQSGYKEGAIGVVFEVRKKPSMELGESQTYNSTRTIYYSYEDVPAEDIVDVLVHGEYGLESLEKILDKAAKGEVKPNSWTSQFNGVLR